MAKPIVLKCKACGKEYDLVQLVNNTRERELYCPSCKVHIGTKS